MEENTKPKSRKLWIATPETLAVGDPPLDAATKLPPVVKPSNFAAEVSQAMGFSTPAEITLAVTEPAAPFVMMVEQVSIAELAESPTNPRKTFGDLEQLAQSIKSVGLVSPLVVRRVGEQLEIVAGHRRFRAAKIAGLETVPAYVRELTDGQALELQLVENLRRSDLNPIEEAEGYEALRGRGLTVEQIAEKIGSSKATVYARLKLIALCPEARSALLDGKLHASVATPLARLSHRLQAKALDSTWLKADADGPAPARAAIEWLQREYTRSLKSCPFSLTDETLVPEAGSCKACPKRPKNAPELFDDLRRAGDVCTDVACYESKAKANWQRESAAAQAAGKKVLSLSDGVALFPHGESLYDSKHVELDAPNHADSKRRTWRELLEAKVKEDERPQVIVAADRSLNTHELVDKRAAVKALAAAGVKWAEQETEITKKRATAAKDTREEDEAEKLRENVSVDLCINVARGLERAIDFTRAVRYAFSLVVLALSPALAGMEEELENAAGLPEGTLGELEPKALEKMKPATLLSIVMLAVSVDSGFTGFGEYADEAKKLAKAFSIDLKALEKARQAAAEAEAAKAKADAVFKKGGAK